MKNIKNKTLKICSLKPLTGYNRDGYCRPIIGDYGSHLVCAKMDKRFLDYSASRGNNLRSVVKEGENWCLCQDRYYQALKAKKAPKIVKKRKATISPTPGISEGIPNLSNGINGLKILSARPTTTQAT